MQQEPDHYDVYEAARILELSPARVRQMLRSGELEGERVQERVEGVPGPWKVRARFVRALRESQEDTRRTGHQKVEAAETVVLEAGRDPTGETDAGRPAGDTGSTPSEAAEMLSESVRGLMEKLEALKRELEHLEGRLEFSEIQEFALKESLARARAMADRERERAGRLQAELDAERRDRRGGE